MGYGTTHRGVGVHSSEWIAAHLSTLPQAGTMAKADTSEGTWARLQLWEVEVQRAGQGPLPTVQRPAAGGSQHEDLLWNLPVLPCWRLLQDCPAQVEGNAGALGSQLRPHWLGRGLLLSGSTHSTHSFPLSLRSSAEQTRMMTASSHLKSSRVTLRTGFSARWSCGSCSAALMDTSPTI